MVFLLVVGEGPQHKSISRSYNQYFFSPLFDYAISQWKCHILGWITAGQSLTAIRCVLMPRYLSTRIYIWSLFKRFATKLISLSKAQNSFEIIFENEYEYRYLTCVSLHDKQPRGNHVVCHMTPGPAKKKMWTKPPKKLVSELSIAFGKARYTTEEQMRREGNNTCQLCSRFDEPSCSHNLVPSRFSYWKWIFFH